MKTTGSWNEVVAEDQQHYASRTKGKLRLEGIKETNPVAVGDWVTFELEDKNGVISEILPRKNHLLVLQAFSELLTHRVCAGPLLPRLQFVVRGNVVALQPFEGRYRVIKASRRHAPSAYGCTHQMHRLSACRQPVTKNKSIQRPENQPLGPTRSAGNDAHIRSPESVVLDVQPRFGASVNTQNIFHCYYFSSWLRSYLLACGYFYPSKMAFF